jgi:hypothetical protein
MEGKMSCKILLFGLDDTLLDFGTNETNLKKMTPAEYRNHLNNIA